MFKRKPTDLDLERIYVASPCPASWEGMKGDDRSRHCGQCDRAVYNISGLTRREVSYLIGNRQERICVRLHRRPDGTVLTRDCPKGLRAYRMRVAKYAGSVFAAVLGLFSVNFAQRPPLGDAQGIRSESSVNVARIEGLVEDAAGAVIPDARVTVVTSSGKPLVTKTDRRGRFRITAFALESGTNRLTIEATGFSPFRDEFTIRRRELIEYPVILEVGFIGVVEIRSEPLIDPRKSEISTTIRINQD